MTCPGSDSGKPFFKIPDKTTFCIKDHIKLVLLDEILLVGLIINR